MSELQQSEKDTQPVKEPHRCFSTPAGTEEEDGVIAGLGDGAGDKVLQLAAQHKRRQISKMFPASHAGGMGTDSAHL